MSGPGHNWNLGEAYVTAIIAAAAIGLTIVSAATELAGDNGITAQITGYALMAGIWAVMLCGSPLVRHGLHPRLDMLVRLFPAEIQRWFEIIAAMAGILFCGLLALHGQDVATLPATPAAERIILFAIAAGMALMTVRYVIRLWQFLFRFDPATMAIRDDDIPGSH
jgi:TRAP-type C4-dicarboxylate transport system permease small subunit